MSKFLIVSTALLCLVSGTTFANEWSNFTRPAVGEPASIGSTSNGCIVGAQALPTEGEGYFAVHLERRRYYGHPQLIQTLQTLAKQAKQQGIGTLQIGDLGQVRGGIMPSGHRSHQTGLDADIWFNLDPAVYANTDSQRSNFRATSMLDGTKKGLNETIWSEQHRKLLELATNLPEVERIFVNPYIKKDLCEKTGKNRAWLQKIRPWYYHDDHFHLRLRCPETSPDCKKQAPVLEGDDCGAGLAWWFEEHPAQPTLKEKPILPSACQALLSQP